MYVRFSLYFLKSNQSKTLYSKIWIVSRMVQIGCFQEAAKKNWTFGNLSCLCAPLSHKKTFLEKGLKFLLLWIDLDLPILFHCEKKNFVLYFTKTNKIFMWRNNKTPHFQICLLIEANLVQRLIQSPFLRKQNAFRTRELSPFVT